jgi:hypothetical protein
MGEIFRKLRNSSHRGRIRREIMDESDAFLEEDVASLLLCNAVEVRR